MPELERYILALLAQMDATMRQAVDAFDFNTYVRTLSDFCNEDLSAFFFDVRKDRLYCDVVTDPKRMAYRTVLDTLFHALVRWAAPVLVFTSEEVWGTRYPDSGSVHLLEWPSIPTLGGEPEVTELIANPRARWHGELVARWERFRQVRTQVTEAIEPYRKDKVIGSSLEAEVTVQTRDAGLSSWIETVDPDELAEVLIVSSVSKAIELEAGQPIEVTVTRTQHHKCGRCWRHLPEVEEDGALCSRCDQVVSGMDAAS